MPSDATDTQAVRPNFATRNHTVEHDGAAPHIRAQPFPSSYRLETADGLGNDLAPNPAVSAKARQGLRRRRHFHGSRGALPDESRG
jgi:hypothetical protein